MQTQLEKMRGETPWMRQPSQVSSVPPIRPPYQVMPSRAKKRLPKGLPVRSDTSMA